jgi:hypothetical protein
MPTEMSFGEVYESSEGFLADEVFESPQEALARTGQTYEEGMAEVVKASPQSFVEEDGLRIPMKTDNQELDAELQQKMESIMESIKGMPCPELRAELQSLRSQMESETSGPKEFDWPSFEQLPPTATFDEPMEEVTGIQEGSSHDETIPALKGKEECGGDQWIVPPHLLRPRGQEASHPQHHQRTINGVCVLALENATKAGRKLHVLTVNPKLSEVVKGRVMRVLLEQQRIHEAVTQTAHTNSHQGRHIVVTGSLVASGASIGQTSLDVDTDASNLRKLVAETYNPLYHDDFPALVGTTSNLNALKLPGADRMFIATPLSWIDVKFVNKDISFD